VKRRKALKDVEVLAIYFGGEWCPHCVTFKPVVDAAYKALKVKAGVKFEIVYVSSDQDQGAFDHYFKQMTWYAVPYEARELKDALSAKFGIEGIPSVMMLKRNKAMRGAFQLMPGGREGRGILSQPPQKVAEDFPWGSEKTLLSLEKDLAELEQSISIVLLCEHLLPRSPDFIALEEVTQKVVDKFLASNQVQDGIWPKLKFIVAHGPPSEPTRWLRAEAHLPQLAQLGGERDPFEVLVVDKSQASPAVHFMRGCCEVLRLPYSLAACLGDEGRLLRYFVETFCDKIWPMSAEAMEQGLHQPPAKGAFGLASLADSTSTRVAEDAAADRRGF